MVPTDAGVAAVAAATAATAAAAVAAAERQETVVGSRRGSAGASGRELE